jgi:hypothetical protein
MALMPEMQPRAPEATAPPERSRPRLSSALVAALLVFVMSLLTDLRVLPTDPARGQDYNDFYVAAVAQSDGLNPYDGTVLTRIEERTFGRSSFSNTVASPPAFFAAMRPLTWLSPGAGYLLWTLASVALYLAALIGLWRSWAGAAPRTPVFWALALSPPAIITVFLGQVTLIVTAAFIWAVAALAAGQSWRAGFWLALTLIVPHVMAVPIALVCGLSWRTGGKEAAIATVAWAAVLSAAALPLAEVGSLAHWLQALTNYGNSFDHWQPDLSSLAGIYIPLVPRLAGRLLSVFALAAGIGLAIAIIAGPQRRALAAGSGWWWRWLMLGSCAWLVVLPYEHPYDAVLLVPALLLLIAVRGQPTGAGKSSHTPAIQGIVLAAVGAMICLPELDLMGFRPNLTFSYTVIPELLATAALALQLRPRTARVSIAAEPRPASPAPRNAAETAGPGRV